MKFKAIENAGDTEKLKDVSVMAIDVGFAQKGNKSCGIATNTGSKKQTAQRLSHAECVKGIVNWLRTNGDAVVILEAPLSVAFSNDNPCPRGEFEQLRHEGKVIQTRYWYSGPGACVTLGAMNILRHLHQTLKKENLTVHLAEGFVSFGSNLDHHQVAESLRDCFLGERESRWKTITEGNRSQSLLQFAGIANQRSIPGIIIPIP